MIPTLAFIGAEAWCPYCGHVTGLPFGDFIHTQGTPELARREGIYLERSREYLHAMGVAVCSRAEWPRGSRTMVPPSELPKEEQERLRAIRAKGWEHHIKAEWWERGE
jgi:hypothetical protein